METIKDIVKEIGRCIKEGLIETLEDYIKDTVLPFMDKNGIMDAWCTIRQTFANEHDDAIEYYIGSNAPSANRQEFRNLLSDKNIEDLYNEQYAFRDAAINHGQYSPVAKNVMIGQLLGEESRVPSGSYAQTTRRIPKDRHHHRLLVAPPHQLTMKNHNISGEDISGKEGKVGSKRI